MNTYKRRIIIFIVAIAVIIGLFIWGKSNHKNIDSLPSLEQVVQMTDEVDLNSYLTHFTKPELTVVWGEPDESSTKEDIWYLDDNKKIIVEYNINGGKVVDCNIVPTE